MLKLAESANPLSKAGATLNSMSHARMRNEVYKIQEGTRVLGRGDIGGREDKAARTSTALQNRQAETIPYHIDLGLVRLGYVPNLFSYNNIGLVALFRPALLWYPTTRFVGCPSKSVTNEKQRSFQLLLTQNLFVIAIV